MNNLEEYLGDEGLGEGVSAPSSSSNLDDTAAGDLRVALPWAKTHRAFEAATAEARALGSRVTDLMARHEDRKRALKGIDAAIRKAIVATVLAEVLRSPHGVQAALSSLGTEPRRYRVSAWSSGQLPKVLDLMHTAGLLEVNRGGWGTAEDRGRGKTATVIKTSPRLRELVAEAGLKASDGVRDFRPLPPPEVIALALAKADRKGSALVDYRETAETRAMRKDVEAVNAWLRRGDLEFDFETLPRDHPPASWHPRVDPADRFLVRRFVGGRATGGRNEGQRGVGRQGGRHYGGFWQGLPKAVRKVGLKIAGSEIVHVDHSAMFVRLSYAAVKGLDVPDMADLYAVPGWEGHREGVKKLVSALWFPRKRPGEGGRLPDEAKALLPEGETLATALEKLAKVHPALNDLWCGPIGYYMMWLESEIMARTLQLLMERLPREPPGVVALPVFDAVVCRREDAAVVAEAMREAFRDVVGKDAARVNVEG